MVLSSEELEILAYLKSWKGTYVSMVEICRNAGGRKRFRESPNWGKGLLARLLDAELVLTNDRGHYAFAGEPETASPLPAPPPAVELGHLVDDNYFPLDKGPPVVVGEDYFPSPPSETETGRWISPQIAAILKQAGKKID